MVIIGHRSSKSTFLKGVKGLERAWIHVVSGILIHLIKWLIFVEFTEPHWITFHFIAPSNYTLQKGAPGRRTPCCSSCLTNYDAQWFWEHILTSLWLGINLSLSALSPFSISYLIKAGSTTLLIDLCLQSKWCRYREDVRCSEWKPPNTSITLIGLLPKREQWAGPVGGCCKIGVCPSAVWDLATLQFGKRRRTPSRGTSAGSWSSSCQWSSLLFKRWRTRTLDDHFCSELLDCRCPNRPLEPMF